MNVGIIGCGIIGHKRAASLGNNKLVAVADIDITKAMSISNNYIDVFTYTDYKILLERKEIDIVIVSTTNNNLAQITLDAVNAGKHVLVEKPGAIKYKEFDPIIAASLKNDVKVKVGYNLRYHPAIQKAIRIARSGELGELMFVRGRYGHGGRLGYEKEWRADKSISGGGELIDQGVHLIDLSMAILGNLSVSSSTIKTYFWNMPVDDNAFINLVNSEGKTAWLHVSCTEWKNTFCLEIYGKKGKLQVDGLGGSYGTEKLTHYEMSANMGLPKITTWEYISPDSSFKSEFEDFVSSLKPYSKLDEYLRDTQEILKIVEEIYDNR